MTAINLAMRNLYGYVIWGNTLASEQRLVYRTGLNLRGFVRQATIGEWPEEVFKAVVKASPVDSDPGGRGAPPQPVTPGSQLRLF